MRRWPTVAVALVLVCPSALADGHHKMKIDDCTRFDQTELDDDAGVQFTIQNKCEVKLSCGIKWTLTCAPGTKRAKKTKEGAAFDLESDTSDGTTALADGCGYDGWEIDDVAWSCEPAE
jgi:hypothetical protein